MVHKRRYLCLVLLAFSLALGWPASHASAQAEPGQIIDSTKPISEELRGHLNAWLAISPPAPAPSYVVTYVQSAGLDTFVSLAAFEGDPATWGLEDGGAVWIGTVIVHEDGSVTQHSVDPSASVPHLAMPGAGPGGGSYVAFPWQSGKQMQYGPRGIHGSGDYGTSGMYAVDLVSGEDLGTGAAPPFAYASNAGEVDYVCDDDVSVAIRTYNSTTDEYFIYAHLLDNSSLAIAHVFSRGGIIGKLKSGSFGESGEGCGWANQQENHYHLHWMFEPAGGAFQAENCILSFSTKKWTCGTKVVGTGNWLTGGGGFGGFDDPNGELGPTTPTFFDYILAGMFDILTGGLISFLPEHNSMSFLLISIYNTAKLALRIAYVLFKGNLNVFPVVAMLGIAFAFRLLLAAVWVLLVVLRALKNLIPGF